MDGRRRKGIIYRYKTIRDEKRKRARRRASRKDCAKELSGIYVVHRVKQLSKGHKLSNLSVYRCKQRLRVCDATDDEGEVDESFAGTAVLEKLLRSS